MNYTTMTFWNNTVTKKSKPYQWKQLTLDKNAKAPFASNITKQQFYSTNLNETAAETVLQN